CVRRARGRRAGHRQRVHPSAEIRRAGRRPFRIVDGNLSARGRSARVARREEVRMIDAHSAPYAVLLLRVALGVLFLAHCWLKLVVFKPAGTVAWFESIGQPGGLAYVAIALELGGGL